MPLSRASVLGIVAVLLGVGGVAYISLERPELISFDFLRAPCTTPITYNIGTYDERFGISREAFGKAIEKAAAVWNTAAGREVFVLSSDPEVPINLSFDERQEAVQLGKSISNEQEQYDVLKQRIDTLRTSYTRKQSRYESDAAAFDRDAQKYEEDVSYWNTRGGAPPAEYEKLRTRKEELNARQSELQEDVAELKSMVATINENVDDLNRVAGRINNNADTFNKALGHDFDQGNYHEDDEGKRITIFTFESQAELTRVLTHEFGHALGIEHVENAESIMYSFNLGTSLVLSDEDKAALKETCKLK